MSVVFIFAGCPPSEFLELRRFDHLLTSTAHDVEISLDFLRFWHVITNGVDKNVWVYINLFLSSHGKSNGMSNELYKASL